MTRKPNLLILGAGGVASATAHKIAQHRDAFGTLTLASRTLARCEALADSLARRDYGAGVELTTATVDARDTTALVRLLETKSIDLVLNLASPYVNLSVMEACLAAGCHYLDTAVHETEGEAPQPAPW